MIVKLEEKEYNIEANGGFMLKFQEEFKENLVVALYKCTQQKDILTCAKLTYCAIQEELPPFEEWLESFETPLFIINEMENITDYIVRSIEPTVKPDSNGGNELKKKTMNQ